MWKESQIDAPKDPKVTETKDFWRFKNIRHEPKPINMDSVTIQFMSQNGDPVLVAQVNFKHLVRKVNWIKVDEKEVKEVRYEEVEECLYFSLKTDIEIMNIHKTQEQDFEEPKTLLLKIERPATDITLDNLL